MTLKALINEISEKYVDKFSEQAVKLYKTYNAEETDEFNKELVNLAYDFIEAVMSSVLEFIRLEYGVIGEPLSRKEILKLFYSKQTNKQNKKSTARVLFLFWWKQLDSNQ